MKKRHAVIRKGTAAEVAEHAAGYSGNGVSIFSREAAQGDRPMTVNDSPRDEPKARVYLLHHQLVAKTDHNLNKLQRRLAVETDPAQRAKLIHNIQIKTKFLRRLLAERMRGQRRHAVCEP